MRKGAPRVTAAPRVSETFQEENWSSRDGSAGSAFGQKPRCPLRKVKSMHSEALSGPQAHRSRLPVSSKAPPQRLIQLTARRHGSSAVTQKTDRT